MAKRYTRWSRRIERNILACYYRATEHDIVEGLHWYQRAHDICTAITAKYNVTLPQAVGVLATLSPGNEWGRNVLEAEIFIEAWTRGEQLPNVGVYGSKNRAKASAILQGADPLDVLPVTGPKVRAFYSCILDPLTTTDVCVDRHAKCLAYNVTSSRSNAASNGRFATVKPAEFRYLAWHYVKLAERLGLIPHQLQAICWVTWKRLAGNIDQTEIPPF